MSKININIERLATFLKKKDESGLKIVRLIQLLLLQDEKDDIKDILQQSNLLNNIEKIDYMPIGTWHPEKQDNEIVFVRKEQPDSMFWETSRNIIKQKKESGIQGRVCMIGESAAAGMFFTPHFSPSIALSNHLYNFDKGQWDVIDLTRNSINSLMVTATTDACLQLNPDFIVIFAGNNWFSNIHFESNSPISKRLDYSKTLSTVGPVGLTKAYRNKLEEHTYSILKKLEKISKKSNAKIIFVIPASNYAQWEHRCPMPWLGEGKTTKWYELYRLASKALDTKNYDEALTLGLQMIALDNGVIATSNHVVANSLIALERFEEAYSYCVAAIDYSNTYDQVTSLPGTPSFVKNIITDYGANNQTNFTIIDVESIFKDYLGRKILDNTLFIDYCHMTPEGFNVAMAPVAKTILSYRKSTIEENAISWKDIVKVANKDFNDINPFSFSIAYFYIALYNIHLNQPIANIQDMEKAIERFRNAVKISDKVLNVMEDYVRARSCEYGAGFTLSKAGQRLIKQANSPLDIPVARFAQGVDAFAIEALCTVLEEHKRDGFKLMSEYQQYYLRLLEKGVDLSEPLYIERITSVIRLTMDSEISTRRRLPYFKSRWPMV